MLGSVAIFLLLAYGGLCVLLYGAQRSMLYFPVSGPAPAGALVEELKSGSETLRLWTRPVHGPRALVYFGGNAEDVGQNFASFAAAWPDRALFFVNYRGYGGSSGVPTESGLFEDALAVFDRVKEQHPEVAVMGRSLGSGVATYVAQQRPVRHLVLVTPYDSIANVAAALYPVLPVRWLIKDRYDSASRAAQVKAPALIVIAERDEVIARERSDALVTAFGAGRSEVVVLRGMGHNDLQESPEYLRAITAFLAKT